MVPDRFEPPRNGVLQLVATGYYGPGKSTYGMDWQDDRWVQRWNSVHDAYIVWPTLTTPDRQMLVWRATVSDTNPSRFKLVAAEVVNAQVTPPDTVAEVHPWAFAYTGTAWGDRKWVGVRDFSDVPGALMHYRFFRSDAPGAWQEIGFLNNLYCWGGSITMAATSHDSVLVVMGLESRGVIWGWLSDTSFTEMGKLNQSVSGLIPQLRRRPSGGYWLFWGDTEGWIYHRTFRDGAWTPTDTVKFVLPGGVQHLLYDSWPSQDDEEYPAVMTQGYGIFNDTRDYLWVSFPTDSGLGVGERVPGTQRALIQCMGMDENGDVWLAWWIELDGIFYTHSYTISTSSPPRIGEQAGKPSLTWTLSEPSPRTWWGVMRAEGDAPFERVGRVRAGASLAMAWADSSAPPGTRLRYAIRRECKDVRYAWTSEAAIWEARGAALALAVQNGNPVNSRLEFGVIGASAGGIESTVSDLQGRVISRGTHTAAGSGDDRFELRLPGSVRPGVYFLRVRGADGRLSPGQKFVVVR